MTTHHKRQGQPTIVKKYANRRLYDTGRSSYVTLEDLCEMVQEGHDFIVVDAKSGEDLTRTVLTQIIVEQEMREGHNLLPTNFLRRLIGFYDDKIQGLVPGYLEHSLNALAEHQEKFKDQINKSMNGINSMGNVGGMLQGGLKAFEDLHKQNVALFENAIRAITPFPLRQNTNTPTSEKRPSITRQERMAQIRQNIAELQRELDKLQKT